MSARPGVGERLRTAFAAAEGGPAVGDGKDCPAPERLWEACRATLGAKQAEEIVRHVAACPTCAAEWRMAMESPGIVQGRMPARWRAERVVAVAAVVAAVAIGLFLFVQDPSMRTRESAFRDTARHVIESTLPDDRPLSREACVLEWSSAGEGARYDLEVSRESLEPVFFKLGLKSTRITVPASALEGIPAGERLVWRVEAELPDGRRVSSMAFVHTLR